MTNHVARLYVAAASLLGLFVAWAGIAAHPWSTPPPGESSTAALSRYEQRLRVDLALAQQLSRRPEARLAVPSVRIVTTPPVTITRTS